MAEMDLMILDMKLFIEIKVSWFTTYRNCTDEYGKYWKAVGLKLARYSPFLSGSAVRRALKSCPKVFSGFSSHFED